MMESAQQLEELRLLGQTVADAFKSLIETPCTNDGDTGMPSRRRIENEKERFRLWARELGLFQLGHSSLDYTVRDSSYIKSYLAELLRISEMTSRTVSTFVSGTLKFNG